MGDGQEAVEELLAERPGLEDDLRKILQVDETRDWGFDDVPLSSGDFGELVDTDAVEETDGGYRFTSPESVRAALGDTTATTTGSETTAVDRVDISSRLQSFRPGRVGIAVGAIVLFAVGFRVAFMFTSVFRGGDIVLAGNDPYFYRFQIDSLLRSHQSLSVDALGDLPQSVADRDVLFSVVLWWSASLLGSDPQTSSGLVLAWYPVIAGAFTLLCVYKIGTLAFNDRRIGLASALILAVTPVHVYRTALGFGDHHAFDYVWLAATVVVLIELSRTPSCERGIDQLLTRSRREWALITALGVSVGAQVLSWRGGPLWLVPIGLFSFALTVESLRRGESPLLRQSGVVLGLGVASLVCYLPHTAFGWMPTYRSLAPAMLAAFVFVVVATGEGALRTGLSHTTFAAGEALLGAGAAAVVFVSGVGAAPIVEFTSYLQETSATGIAETQSLFSTANGVFGQPILLFGFVFLLAIPYLLWATIQLRDRARPALLALVVYTWFTLVMAIVQIRFAGQLSMFLSVFGGVILVHLAQRLEIIESRPIVADSDADDPYTPTLTVPEPRYAAYMFVLFLLVAGVGPVQGVIKMGQVAVDDNTYQTATSIDRYGKNHDLQYPETFVLSRWPDSRAYNYIVSGDRRASGYIFARENYERILSSQDERAVYRDYHDTVGFIVTEETGTTKASSLQARLHEHNGSRTGSVAGLSHFRIVSATPNGNQKAFELVRGATVVGTGAPNTTVEIQEGVVVSEHEFSYRRVTQSTASGVYAVTVPYPGTYTNVSQPISEDDVRSGAFFVDPSLKSTGLPAERARWTFDTRLPETTVDRIGSNHGQVFGAEPSTDAAAGNGSLVFTGSTDYVRVPDNDSLDPGDDSFTLSFWLKGDLSRSTSEFPRVVSKFGDNGGYRLYGRTDSDDMIVAISDGNQSVKNFGMPTDTFDNWTHIAVRIDRQSGNLDVFQDGEIAGSVDISSLGSISTQEPLYFGRGSNKQRPAYVSLDEVRIFDEPLDQSEIRRLTDREG